MSIVFSVIDLSCQSADQSFFVPQVNLTTKSTTTFATLYGYSEFIPSVSPPRKYKTVTFSGSSGRVAFTGESTPRQCGGARYDYSGQGTVDSKGHQLTNYVKNFFVQCAKQYWPIEGVQLNPNAINTQTGPFSKFVGFCWPDDPQSCSMCDPDTLNWFFAGNQAVNIPGTDLSGFIHHVNSPVVTPTSWSVNDTFIGLTSIAAGVPYSFTGTGSLYNVTVGSNTYPAEAVITNPDVHFPHEVVSGFEAGYIVFTDTNNYSAVLSDQYTDAEALANAQIVVGKGATAQNSPRTTGFTSVTTSVVYTINCSNLISGNSYTVTVDLWEQGPGGVNTHTSKAYGFIATDKTHTITDVVPTPIAGHTITVQKPVIAFAP